MGDAVRIAFALDRLDSQGAVMMLTLFALLGTSAATLSLFAVALKLAATGEIDWPMLAAGLLVLTSATAAWRHGARRKRAPG